MHFLNPWLLFGAAGVSVPIAIHLLNRFRFRTIDWGAMELLRRALVVRSNRVHLEDLLLLALRCLAILLIALALARPTLSSAGILWAGGEGSAGAVIAIDASYSMEHRPGLRSRFDQALDRARAVFKTLRPGAPVTLVLMGDRPRYLLRNIGFDSDRFEEALKNAAPLPERFNLEACLDELPGLLRELKTPTRECYLITDAQTTTWGQPSERARQALHEVGSAGTVFFLPVGGGQAENVALVRFERKSGLLHKGSTAAFEAEVRNTGMHERNQITLSLLVNDVPIDERLIEHLRPGESITVPLWVRFDRAGTSRLTAKLGPDELATDNLRHLVADVQDRTRVLYVSGNVGKGEKDYVKLALAPRPGGALEVDATSWLDLGTKTLADYRVVVLSNVPDLGEEQVRALFYFVKQGGGLIVLPGDSTQPALFGSRLKQDDVSLLPAEFVDGPPRDSQDDKGWTIELESHPLCRVLSGLSAEARGEARIYRYLPLKLDADGRAVLKRTGSDDVLMAEKQLGRGRVVLFAFAADRTWTNMVVDPGFYPLLLHESIVELSRRPFERAFLVGQPMSVPLPVGETARPERATFRDPSGKTTSSPTALRDGQTLAELERADRPGFYEIQYGDDTPPVLAAVNVDPAESDVRALQGDALREALAGLPLRLVAEDADVVAAVHEGRVGRELWKELLMLALIVLLLEAYFAQRFSRGGREAAAPGEARAALAAAP
jgi:hypothetical protein